MDDSEGQKAVFFGQDGRMFVIESDEALGEMVDVGLRDVEAGRGMPAHEAIDMIRKRNNPPC